MAMRLFLFGLFVTTLVACQGTKKNGDSNISSGSRAALARPIEGRDAIEIALMSLGFEGRVLRVDLNEQREKKSKLEIAQAHLIGDILLLESDAGVKVKKTRKPSARRSPSKPKPGVQPMLLALRRSDLYPLWVSPIMEPNKFPIAANHDTVVLISEHYAHALELDTGRRAIRFMKGELAGLAQPFRRLAFTPTAGAAVGNDTMYLPTLGTAANNKTIMSRSLIVGLLGWGYRSSADVLTTPAIGGGASDPKLYFVTRTGHVVCMDATNYGFPPRGTNWEQLLEAGVDYDLLVTADDADEAGAVFLADRTGVVYCLNRITGERRWVNATGKTPTGGPTVFGNICVVPMESGLLGFDTRNVIYALREESGESAGKVHWIRAGKPRVLDNGLTVAIEGEVLVVSGAGVAADDGAPGDRAVVRNGSKVLFRDQVLLVEDHGSAPLWTDLGYDRIVGRVGEQLIAQKGNTLVVIDQWTGEAAGAPVSVPGARLIPTNSTTANLFVIGGDATVYALFAG